MKNLKEFYTVLIVPSPTSKPHRFTVTKRGIKIGVTTLAALLVAVVILFVQFARMAQDHTELTTLRRESHSQKLQLQSFASGITDLKKQMTRLKELDAKLRVITDIGPPPQAAQLMGQGGQEEPGLDEASQSGQRQEDLVNTMEHDLRRLQAEGAVRELSFEELTETMKDKRSLWAATPSIWPVRGWLTSGFGSRVSPFTGNPDTHNGIDVAARRDTPVVAPAAGVVAYEGFDSGLGKMVKVAHGYGMQSMYGHLAKTNVKIGQKVKRGDVIGLVGSTGLSTGPHLHYEVYINGVAVNPLRYILD